MRERKLYASILLLSGIILAGCMSGKQKNEETATAGTPSEAEKIYQQFCSTCHGKDLRGGNAQSLLDGVWQFGDGDGYVRRNIQFGIPHLGMPSFENLLTKEQIDQLVEYLYDEQSEAGAAKPDPASILETKDYRIKTEIWADNLSIPWGIVFLDGSRALITERPGGLRMVENGQLLPDPVEGTPEVLHEGQGGLMDVNIDPDFEKNGWIYLSYSHKLEQAGEEKRPPAMTRIVRGRINDLQWTDEELIYEAPNETYLTTRHHYGNRIVFDKKGYLYFSIGDRGAKEMAQDPTKPNGKIHRIYPDGSVPPDNPFAGKGLPTLFTLGNRNPQGLSVHPGTDEVWSVEHGPLGGDELNLIRKGINYGWPVISYGRNYNGTIITEYERMEGYEQPVIYWKPSIAVCGMEFYHGEAFQKWNNKLLVAALKYEEVILLDIEADRVMHQEVILKNAGRVRDVGMDPEGNIYVVVNEPDRVIKLSAAESR